MNDILLIVGLIFLAACVALTLIGALLQWLQWLVATILLLLASGLHLLWHGMGKTSRALARVMQTGTVWTAMRIWRGIKASLSALRPDAQPASPGAPAGPQWQEPHWAESPSLWGHEPEEHMPRAARSAYDDALSLLGLVDVQPLTSALLRQRYAELIRTARAQDGSSDTNIAQKLNAAVLVLRRAHGW